MVNKKFQKNPKTVKPNLSVTCQYSESRKKRGEIYFEKERINMKKKVISLLLALCILCGCLPIMASAAESGKLSDTISWRFDKGTQTLYLSGTGATPDYYSREGDPPFPEKSMGGSVRHIVVEEGITTLGCGLFDTNFHYVESIDLPEGLTTLKLSSISTKLYVKRMVLPKSIKTIENYAFDLMLGSKIVIPKGVETIGEYAFDRFQKGILEYEGTKAEWDATFSHVKIAEGTKVVAKGEPHYTVSFDPNGGTVSPSTKTVQRYAAYGSLPAPSGNGRQFAGWFTEPNRGSRIFPSDTYSLVGDQTLYAHWGSNVVSALEPAIGEEPVIMGEDIGTEAYGGTWGMGFSDAHAKPLTNYVYANETGGVTRVTSYYDSSEFVVEEYNENLELQAKKTFEHGFAFWGGFYAGATYNFVVVGNENKEADDNRVVVRVLKYDKGWNLLGSADLKGINTVRPFGAGSLRCAEADDILYIHTSHVMYRDDDGPNHQANMTISLRESTMELLGGNCRITNNSTGYVSHSFNQFVLVDQEDHLVTLDHGDAYPRSFMLTHYDTPASQGVYADFSAWDNVVGTLTRDKFAEFPGSLGANGTGARMYSFVETDTGYLAVFDYKTTFQEAGETYLYYYDKAAEKGEMRKLGNGKNCTNAHFVPDGSGGGYLLWTNLEKNDVGRTIFTNVNWTHYDNEGNLGKIYTSRDGFLTTCVPALYHGKLVWTAATEKAWKEPSKFLFFSIDQNNQFHVTSYHQGEEAPTVGGFRDVHENDFFADAVKWAVEEGITTGTEKNYFSPKMNCTRGQAVAFLWRAAGKPDPQSTNTGFTDVKAGFYYETAVQWAVEQGITIGTSADKFSPNAVCTRAQIVTLLHRAAGEPAPAGDSAGFTDVKAGSYYETAVKWAVEQGITVGTAADKFSPNVNCTRGQIVTFLYRNAEKK